MYDIPPSHLPADFANSNLPKNLYVCNGDTVYLKDVHVLNNAAILKVSQVLDLLVTLGNCFVADSEREQALISSLQLAASALEQAIHHENF